MKLNNNFLARYNHSMGFGEYKDGKLASYVMVNEFESRIFAKKVKMRGSWLRSFISRKSRSR